jgi:sporulation protein YlmC with PRC-barrel domain
MPVTVKDVNEMFNKDVFTNKGFYVGKVRDVEFDLSRFKVRSLVIEVARGTFLDKLIGGKKGIIVPYPIVQSVGDIVIIKHITAAPAAEGEVTAEEIETEKA